MADKKTKIALIGLIVLITVWVVWPASEHEDSRQIADNDSLSVVQRSNFKPTLSEKQLATQPVISSSKPEQMTVEKGMQYEMRRVADIYEKRSQYAPYSLYLSPAQTDLIHPNQTYESPRQYNIDGKDVSILIEPEYYRFASTESVNAHIQLRSSEEGLNSVTNLKVYLARTGSKDHWSMTLQEDTKKAGARSIHAKLNLETSLSDFPAAEYSIVAEVEFNNNPPVIQSAPIRIVDSVAKITGVGSSRIENNDLIIPIVIDADKSGYYQVSASLFDKATNSPVSYLIAKERLNSGSNILNAKVQGLVLRDKGSSGPFLLQGITLVKKSERPGMAEEYGSHDESYEIEAVNLNDFESIPYEDPMTEKRLEFMRSIGQ